MANQSVNVVSLDFNQIKESLKVFLQSQETLKDYSFDGSVLNTILDVLAYNTHYQAFYANMVANEMFLDSAVMRPSVVSHAKVLGYVPSSRRAATSVLDIPVTVPVSSSTYLARGSEFTGVDGGGTSYRFVTLDTHYADLATNGFKDVRVYEGILRRISYIYDPAVRQSTYLLIPNDKVDTSTIRVRVQNSTTDTTGSTDTWSLAESYIDLTPTSKVFFLQERQAGMYEVYFGDDFLGKKPSAGNLVVIEYLETNAEFGNGITTFSTSVGNLGTITATSSSGGAKEETVSSIKFLAPKFYASQNRAVTEDDYAVAVGKEYPNAGSVLVYGGETVTPPQYGKVFVAIKPKSGSALTTDEKTSLVDKLRTNRSVVTIIPEIVDPDYIDLVVDSLVTYDPSLVAYSPGTLKALVVAYAYSYSSSSLEAFGKNLYLSKLTQGINGINTGILGNQTTIKLRKTINLSKLVASKGFSIDFRNPLYHPHDGHSSVIGTSSISHKNMGGQVVSSVFAEDDGYGIINLVSNDASGKKILVYANIGRVDYDAGVVNFNTSFRPVSATTLFTVTVQPRNTDIFVFENKILRISRGYSDSVRVSLNTQVSRKQNLKG